LTSNSTPKLDLPLQITTNRLLLKRFRHEDAEEVFNVYASVPEVTKFMAWPIHTSLDDTRSFLDYADDSWDNGSDYSYSVRLATTGELVGSFGLLNMDGKLQFGYSFGPRYWNRGYATEVCKTMMTLLKSQTGVFRIGTYVDTENVASARVLEKAGLVQEAKLEKWSRFVNQGNAPKDCFLYRLP
jgi:ribosomal-protein-alanine N-acetyltransferase